ncbi:hypothetical protein [Sediminibacterium ginsengisoli]|uniref:Uncharacterized protein n=1 Tax=Sediminibacterium ginsengisoli TaxID=413434 RepID=A0A1T4RMC7_9BACT|nr:hypothetical protein [Sediminibacterium ginsengisoli]SKA17119.1 hypothetical protein SAMN04488132_11358 [Sediminibacterium ginsengisoli]
MKHPYPVVSVDEIDFGALGAVSNYDVMIKEDSHPIYLKADRSPGGSAEGGYELMILEASLNEDETFRFTIHPQDFLYEIGKFFGAEDIETGYADFDRLLIVKTNDTERFRKVFSNAQTRQAFQTLSGFSLSIRKEDQGLMLTLRLQRILSAPTEFIAVYNAFTSVLYGIDGD